jgi:hypothetical protein
MSWLDISHDGIDGTFRLTNATVDTFVRMDDEHIFALIEAVHGTHCNAVRGFAANTAIVDDVSQFSTPNPCEILAKNLSEGIQLFGSWAAPQGCVRRESGAQSSACQCRPTTPACCQARGRRHHQICERICNTPLLKLTNVPFGAFATDARCGLMHCSSEAQARNLETRSSGLFLVHGPFMNGIRRRVPPWQSDTGDRDSRSPRPVLRSAAGLRTSIAPLRFPRHM